MHSNDIPVVSIRRLDEGTLSALDRACREWGFFQVVDHGIPDRVLQNLHAQMRHFFAQPTASKRALSRTAANPWGFFDRELTKNTRDWKQVYDYGPGDDHLIVPQWPSAMPAFRTAVLDYYRAGEVLALRLLDALTMNLGAPEGLLRTGFGRGHSSFVRLNFYPKCSQPGRPAGLSAPETGHLGVNHHTDSGALTILLQDDQPGLEVFRHGAWHLVAPRADALVVNIGDIVQVWSNDRYQAAIHRVVVNPQADRYSAPFFLNPTYETRYAPLASTVDTASPPRYRPICWGEFRSERAAGDYADHGEEIQISHFRIQGKPHGFHFDNVTV